MDLNKKSINLEIKADEADERSFTAYASKFGNVDSYNDVCIEGCYVDSLASGRKVRMLFNHDPNTVIGKFEEIREDEVGLFVKGKFSDTARGNEVRQLVLDGAIDSLSIGYQTKEYEYNKEGHRLLRKVDLWEISFVTFPANDQASIISAKAAAADDVELISLLNARIAILRAE